MMASRLLGRTSYSRPGKHIPCRRDLAPPAAFKRVLGILDLSKRLELMLPLFLLLHLGPLFELFHEAGHPPRFVVFLAGTTRLPQNLSCSGVAADFPGG